MKSENPSKENPQEETGSKSLTGLTDKGEEKPETVSKQDYVELQKQLEEAKAAAYKASKAPTPEPAVQPMYSLRESQARAQAEKLSRRADMMRSGTEPMIPGNVDPSYQLREWDKGFYHVRVTKHPPENANRTIKVDNGRHQQVIDLPVSVKKINVQSFKRMEKSQAFKGFLSLEILHDPTK